MAGHVGRRDPWIPHLVIIYYSILVEQTVTKLRISGFLRATAEETFCAALSECIFRTTWLQRGTHEHGCGVSCRQPLSMIPVWIKYKT